MKHYYSYIVIIFILFVLPTFESSLVDLIRHANGQNYVLITNPEIINKSHTKRYFQSKHSSFTLQKIYLSEVVEKNQNNLSTRWFSKVKPSHKIFISVARVTLVILLMARLVRIMLLANLRFTLPTKRVMMILAANLRIL